MSHAMALDLMDGEDDVLMHFLVHGQLAGLTEGAIAPFEVALERFLLRVDVGVLLQILRQGKSLEAQDADMLLDGLMRGNVASQRKSGRVCLVTTRMFTNVRFLHFALRLLFLL